MFDGLKKRERELEESLDRCVAHAREQAEAIVRLEKRGEVLKLRLAFTRQERDVFRRRWEKAVRPPARRLSASI